MFRESSDLESRFQMWEMDHTIFMIKDLLDIATSCNRHFKAFQ